jgi:hypothetical protein
MSSTCNTASPSCTIENIIPDFLVQRSGNRWYNKEREYFIALPTKITSLPEGACKDIVFMKHEKSLILRKPIHPKNSIKYIQ